MDTAFLWPAVQLVAEAVDNPPMSLNNSRLLKQELGYR